MPRFYDNIENEWLPTLRNRVKYARHADDGGFNTMLPEHVGGHRSLVGAMLQIIA